jgi:hypothetical protein
MDISFDEKEIVSTLMNYAEIPALNLKLRALKGIDWNPFDEDGDKYIGIFDELRHNYDLIWDAAKAFVNTAERLVVGGESLTNVQKHKVVCDALDRAIRVPFFLEPFDDILIGVVVTGAVKWFNSLGWGPMAEDKIVLTPNA